MAILNAAFRQMAGMSISQARRLTPTVGHSAVSARYTVKELAEVKARREAGEDSHRGETDVANEQADRVDHVSPNSPWHAVTTPRWVTTSILALTSYQISEYLHGVDTLEATADMIAGTYRAAIDAAHLPAGAVSLFAATYRELAQGSVETGPDPAMVEHSFPRLLMCDTVGLHTRC